MKNRLHPKDPLSITLGGTGIAWTAAWRILLIMSSAASADKRKGIEKITL
jgi:hypothetical protein